jgi:hypothetical protein
VQPALERMISSGTALLRRAWPWLVVALPLAIWYARPLWVTRYLPLHDLPNHLARITAYHHLHDARWNLSSFYAPSLQLVPYLGHYLAVDLLAYVCGGVVRADTVFLTLYVLAAPLCGVAFARATGRSPWLALLMLPLSVSMFFQWGFIAFCVGSMLLLPALAALYRVLDEPTAPRALALGLWTAALYLFHVIPWGALGICALVLFAFELSARRTRGPLLASLAMAPSLAMLAIGVREARRFGYLGGHKYQAQVDAPAKLLERAVQMIDLWQSSHVDEWVVVGIALIVVLLAVTGAPAAEEPLRRRVRVPAAFTTLVALAALTPFWVKQPFNWWMVNLRFLLPAAEVAVFLPRGRLRGGRAALLGGAIALSALLPGPMARNYADFGKRLQPLIDLIRVTPFGATTLVLHRPPPRTFDDPVLAPRVTYWREVYNYPLVLRGGYDPYLYDDGFPVKRIRALPAPKVERAAEHITSPSETKFDAATMMRGWDYFIVPEQASGEMPADGAVFVRQAGDWLLYRNIIRDPTPAAR